MIDEALLARARATLIGKPQVSYVTDATDYALAILALEEKAKKLEVDYKTMLETLTASQVSGSKAVVEGQKARASLRWALGMIGAVDGSSKLSSEEFAAKMEEAREASMPSNMQSGELSTLLEVARHLVPWQPDPISFANASKNSGGELK